jgi:cell division protein FtsI/penicillin-binding protein 2
MFRVLLIAALSLSAAAQNTSLQVTTERAIGLRKGTAFVVEVKSGKLLASNNLDLASTRLATPGSTIKPFVLAALLKSPGFNPDARLMCRRKLNISGHSLDCSHPPSPEALNATEALAYSCNNYFAESSKFLEKDALIRELRQRGFTATTGLAPNEVVGRIRSPKTNDDARLLALGADLIEVTPLELASAYRKLALEISQPHTQAQRALIASGLRAATDYGMASNARAESISVAGKTGTASDPGSAATHAWFVGFSPADNPEIVVLVFLERGRGLEAAALARGIFDAYASTKTPESKR